MLALISALIVTWCWIMPPAHATALIDMVDALDARDRQDLDEHVAAANQCTRKRDFTCAEDRLAQARKLINGARDRQALAAAQASIAKEREVVAEEARERARRVAQAERERREREEEEERERERERRMAQAVEEDRPQRVDYGAAIAAGINSALAGKAGIDAIHNNMMRDLARRQAAAAAQREQAQERARQERLEQQRAAQERRAAQEQRQAQAERQRAQEERQAQAERQRAQEDRQAQSDRQRAQEERQAQAERQRAQEERQAQAERQRAQEERQAQDERQRAQEQQRIAMARALQVAGGGGASTGRFDQAGPVTGRVAPTQAQIQAPAPAPVAAPAKKVEMGPEVVEAIAVCWESLRQSGRWRCHGPTQDTLTSDDPLDMALKYAGCPDSRATDGSRTIRDREAIVHLCGFGLRTSDDDVARKYAIAVQRNHYQCARYQIEKCRDNYRN